MANRNALPYKLTLISKEKLAREATAPDPDLRRCVAHFRLHCGSVLWTENDMKSRISSFEFEETDSEDENDTYDPKDESKTRETFVTIQIADTSNSQMTAPPPEISCETGLLDQGSNCIDMDSKNFCCISVQPIAG